ncbi:MAG: thioredoxin [Thermoleophilia bacterium]
MSTVTCPSCGATSRIRANAPGRPVCRSCKTRLPWVVDADTATFPQEVAGPLPTIVDFWAAWCGPCRAVAPALMSIAERHAGEVKVVKVDVDANQQLAQQFQAMSIPLLVFFKNGQERDRVVGAQPAAALEARLAPLLTG